mmetsp:Transcript_9725/g.21827  ORF Transcript_9725/g.21827 Transcript_9725/m.21827 type:complete len:234 (-) Transcript_9725:18-719(-)
MMKLNATHILHGLLGFYPAVVHDGHSPIHPRTTLHGPAYERPILWKGANEPVIRVHIKDDVLIRPSQVVRGRSEFITKAWPVEVVSNLVGRNRRRLNDDINTRVGEPVATTERWRHYQRIIIAIDYFVPGIVISTSPWPNSFGRSLCQYFVNLLTAQEASQDEWLGPFRFRPRSTWRIGIVPHRHAVCRLELRVKLVVVGIACPAQWVDIIITFRRGHCHEIPGTVVGYSLKS